MTVSPISAGNGANISTRMRMRSSEAMRDRISGRMRNLLGNYAVARIIKRSRPYCHVEVHRAGARKTLQPLAFLWRGCKLRDGGGERLRGHILRRERRIPRHFL